MSTPLAPAVIPEVEVQAISETIVNNPDPLTCYGVSERREKLGKLKGEVAAYTHSSMFKLEAPWKPMAMRFDHRLSVESVARKSTVIKSLAKHLGRPGMISLGGGLPSSDYFPFEHLDVTVPTIKIFPEEEIKRRNMSIGKHDVKDGTSMYDLSIALNYGQASGSAQMIRWVTEHTEIVHNPPYRNWACVLSHGSTTSLEIMYRMFLERGDYIISEEYTFATAVEASHPMGCKFVGVKMDMEGLLPDSLDELLDNWDPVTRNARKPFIVYTVPSGQNPTGSTQGAERRRRIYQVARKHDLIIIEDEPYYFLQMQPYTGVDSPSTPLPDNHQEFLKSLIPSYLSIDLDGRVIRLDSFSKVIAPGTRCGWITASEQICERMQRHSEVSFQFPSGFSQVILHRLLDEEWGHCGYLDWLINLRVEYTKRRDVILKACEKYLPKEIAKWTVPAAGMFHWINLDISKHPDFGVKTAQIIENELFKSAVEECVLIAPGSFFLAEKGSKLETLYFRTTFAAAEPGAIAEGIRRFGVALRKAFQITCTQSG